MRMEELTQDVAKLKRYYQNDDVITIDYDDELGVMIVVLTEQGFLKKFNKYEETTRPYGLRARRFVDGVMFTATLTEEKPW